MGQIRMSVRCGTWSFTPAIRPVAINTGMKNAGLDFYPHLEKRNLSWSLRDYSSHYLGMAPNYACLRGDRGPSERALINMFRRLCEERHYILAARVAWTILWGERADG